MAGRSELEARIAAVPPAKGRGEPPSPPRGDTQPPAFPRDTPADLDGLVKQWLAKVRASSSPLSLPAWRPLVAGLDLPGAWDGGRTVVASPNT